jgi:hypothetical protein
MNEKEEMRKLEKEMEKMNQRILSLTKVVEMIINE